MVTNKQKQLKAKKWTLLVESTGKGVFHWTKIKKHTEESQTEDKTQTETETEETQTKETQTNREWFIL